MPNPPKKLILYCDGASRGNPGPASYGFVILENGSVIDRGLGRLGTVTNNVAEYQGLLHALVRCQELGATEVVIRSDSQLMVRQLLGQYKIKSPGLIPLFQKAKELLTHFSRFYAEHVPREENKLADALANEALDKV